MKRNLRVAMISFVFLLTVCAVSSFAAESQTDARNVLQGIDRIENIVYGAPQSGGLLFRLSAVEKELFGMELPGSLTERELALVRFVEEGSATQPSLIFKISVAEWVTLHRLNPTTPLTTRITTLEKTLENDAKTGALSARLERVISKILPGGLTTTDITVGGSTVLKAKFVKTLTVRNVKKNDQVELELLEDCIVNGVIAAAKGNRLMAEVTKVKMPRSFGRPSEIGVQFKTVETLNGGMIPVFLGPEAEKAMKLDSGTAGAAGASLLGAALIGPVGLAGGFLVRGNDKQIAEGTLVYVETSEQSSVKGFTVPGAMLPLPEQQQVVPQGAEPVNPPN